MKNKKGWIRIAEAFIAILLITIVLLVIYTRTETKNGISEEIYKVQKVILDEIADNPTLRESVLKNDEDAITNFVSERIPSGFSFSIKICEINNICNLDVFKEEVYSSERVISSTLQEYSPKKLKIFMWLE